MYIYIIGYTNSSASKVQVVRMYVCLSSLCLGLWCGTHDLQEPKMTAQSVPEGWNFIMVESKFGVTFLNDRCYLGTVGLQHSWEQVMRHLVILTS